MTSPHSLIVGGTRGIGREVAALLEKRRHKVSVIARRLPERTGGKRSGVRYWAADVCDEAALTATLAQIVKRVGKINYLVFLQRHRGNGDSWHGEIKTSMTATKNVVEALQNSFAEGDKSVVVVGSIAGSMAGDYLRLGYHAAKAALRHMVRYWAVQLGGRGIRVNSVSPGTILKEESKDFFLKNRKLREMYRRITPLHRFGHAREVADVIGCLCSEQTSFVTGQDIVVDGGVSLQWQESLSRDLLGMPYPSTGRAIRSRRKS